MESWGKFWWESFISLSGSIGCGLLGLSKLFLFFRQFGLSSLLLSGLLSLSLGSLFLGGDLSLVLTDILILRLSELKFGVRDLAFSNSLIIVFLFSSVNPESLFH